MSRRSGTSGKRWAKTLGGGIPHLTQQFGLMARGVKAVLDASDAREQTCDSQRLPHLLGPYFRLWN